MFVVFFQFLDFALEGRYEDECSDYVFVWNGEGASEKMCGQRPTEELQFVSQNGLIIVTFLSDSKFGSNGFRAAYCVQLLKDGMIISLLLILLMAVN